MTPASAAGRSGAAAAACVLGVDSGGSGLRVQVALRDGGSVAPATVATPVRTGPGGIDPGHLMELLVPMAEQLLAEAGAGAPRAVAVGAAGMATLGAALRAELPAMLEEHLGVRRVALAADAVTAYVGALGGRPGAVVAAGTGLIALGTDLTAWRRADGWGHLLGDCGSGAWIGRAGLEAALRAHDGRPGGSAALLARAEATFGPAPGLPGALYPRTDRAGVLASFAPEVAAAAVGTPPAAHPAAVGGPAAREVPGSGHPAASDVPGGTAGPGPADPAGAVDALATGDPVAAGILRAAARHIAEAAAAVCPTGGSCEVALTGGLLRIGEPLLGPLRRELAAQLPQARQVPAAGDPLDGAVRIALDLADDHLTLPVDGRMLYVRAEPHPASAPAAAEPGG